MAGSQISHVIFDMDGLLLDTEGFYTKVQKRILAKYDREFSWDLKVILSSDAAHFYHHHPFHIDSGPSVAAFIRYALKRLVHVLIDHKVHTSRHSLS